METTVSIFNGDDELAWPMPHIPVSKRDIVYIEIDGKTRSLVVKDVSFEIRPDKADSIQHISVAGSIYG